MIAEHVKKWEENRKERIAMQAQLGVTVKEEDDGVGEDMRDVVVIACCLRFVSYAFRNKWKKNLQLLFRFLKKKK